MTAPGMKRTAMTVACACLLLVMAIGGASCSPSSFDKATSDGITTIVQKTMKEQNIPGAVVGVWKKGQSYLKAFGKANLASGAAVKTGDVFREASITKTYTAVEVLRLVEQGKLKLADTLSKWDFTQGLPNRDVVTVQMLLNHTSGYPDPSNDDIAFITQIFTDPLRDWTPPQLVQVAISDNNYLPPGKEYRYSNFGYVLLGMIVESVTGRPFGSVIENDILKPLSLAGTGFDNASAFIQGRSHASGYFPNVPGNLPPGVTIGGGEKVDTTTWNTSWTWSAGSMCGNVPDLKTWIEADASGKLLKPATVKLQQQTFAVAMQSGQPLKYGLGIITLPLMDGTTMYWHNGAVPGYSTFAGNSPGDGVTVVVLLDQNPSPDGDSVTATQVASQILVMMGLARSQ